MGAIHKRAACRGINPHENPVFYVWIFKKVAIWGNTMVSALIIQRFPKCFIYSNALAH